MWCLIVSIPDLCPLSYFNPRCPATLDVKTGKEQKPYMSHRINVSDLLALQNKKKCYYIYIIISHQSYTKYMDHFHSARCGVWSVTAILADRDFK